MSKALIKGELDQEFKKLDRQDNSKPKLSSKTKPVIERLPTNRHGLKKALKRLKVDRKNPRSITCSKKRIQQKGKLHISIVF